MTPNNDIIASDDYFTDTCNCESCDRLRAQQDHDPYFSDRDEFDRAQEDHLFPDLDFDGDILDLY